MARPRSLGFAAFLLVALVLAMGCRTPQGETAAEKRSAALQMKQDALNELYRTRPEARSHVQKAPGYAVFSNVGSKILVLATGNGFGVATDNRSGKNTFMRMLEAGGGVGLGIKTYRAVYVFNDAAAFDSFVEGHLQVGGDADVALQHEGQGASAAVALDSDQLTRPVTVYQFTESGVALSAVATGTRYFPDDALN